LIETS